MANRKKIEDRILHIIAYINHNEMLSPLKWSIKLFSLEELLQLLEFLETWDYKPIYILLDKKIKEYILTIKEIKQIQIKRKMQNVKTSEIKEKQEEEKNLEQLLQF